MDAFFRSPNPSFFKIILHQTITQRKLDLPFKFVNNNGDSLLLENKVTLCLPDGANWNIQLKKFDTKFCFLKGWPEFVHFYSIQPGHLLVFKLKGTSRLNVRIFDTSATEINYPIYQIPKTEIEDLEESVQIVNKPLLKTKRRRKEKNEEIIPCCSVKKTMRKNVKMRIPKHRGITSNHRDEEDLEIDSSRTQTKHSRSGEGDSESMRPMYERKTAAALTENQLAVKKRASWFRSRRNNPSFMVTMRPSYIQTGNFLNLPRRFGEKYIKESVDVILELEDGTTWKVWCGVRWAFTRRRTEFKAGWKTFVEDNELKEGDICVFELIDKNVVVLFKVTIFSFPNA